MIDHENVARCHVEDGGGVKPLQVSTPPPSTDYAAFLERRAQLGGQHGFDPIWLPDALKPFQYSLVEWAIRKGRGAILADCGLGKTLMQLVWAENVARHTNKPVLVATPLAVSYQTVAEGEKFGIDVRRCADGQLSSAGVYVTNYERLHLVDGQDLGGFVCDESSILKNFDGVRRRQVQELMRRLPFRLLCTATAAPNDYVELGTSSEALGEMGHMDMLARFFKNDRNTSDSGRYCGEVAKWRFKHHAQQAFWRWVCSWARACRKPSDIGFPDAGFDLPALTQTEHIIKTARRRDGMLFAMPAVSLPEQRDERRRSIEERCAKVAELVAGRDSSLVWCHLNPEGDLLASLIPGAVQVSGSDSDDAKEEKLLGFARGQVRVLVTKPKIGAWGLNLQHCAHVTFFPSHSYEQFYQGVRRCWRFGQTRPVHVDVVASEGERGVLANLLRKAAAADLMFASLVAHMGDALQIPKATINQTKESIPAWLSPTN